MHRIQTSDYRFHADTIPTPEFINSIQEEIVNVIEAAGIQVNVMSKDLYGQLWLAMQVLARNHGYDYIVDTQEKFNYLCTRQGANHYHINNNYKSVLFKCKTGGYLCYGTDSFLQGSDTWGYIQTNLCVHLVFEEGAYFNSGTNPFYVEMTTDNCRLDNVYIKGSTAGAGAISRGFILNAYHVIYNNCKVSDRLSNVAGNSFCGSATEGHNLTSKYINCSVFGLKCGTALIDTAGFSQCSNLSNCLVYDLDSTTGGRSVFGFQSCNRISSSFVYDLDGTTGSVIGFSSCKSLSSCMAYDLESTTGSCIGFYDCYMLSSCSSSKIDNSGAGNASGFQTCFMLSGCWSSDIDTVGGTAYGFGGCTYISASYTDEAVNPLNTYVDTDDADIVAALRYSCPPVFT
jgi:hypothetical protein